MAKKKKPVKRNTQPSLVKTLASSYFPLGDMEGLAKGASADLKRVKKAVNAKRKTAPTRSKKRRHNPAEQAAAAALYADFHQKPADSVTTFVEEEMHRSDLAELGDMVSLVVATLSGYRATIVFDDDPPKLCSSADRRQLYIKGGDQTLDLGALHMSGPDWLRDDMVIGVVTKLTYRTEKGFDDFQLTDYFHHLGEETGMQPFLRYDTLNRRLHISGGQYAVKHEGITN